MVVVLECYHQSSERADLDPLDIYINRITNLSGLGCVNGFRGVLKSGGGYLAYTMLTIIIARRLTVLVLCILI